MKRIMFLILVGIITMGFSAQSYAALNASGWSNGKIGGVITGDETFTNDTTGVSSGIYQVIEGFPLPPNPNFVVPSVEGLELTATGSTTSGGVISYILNSETGFLAGGLTIAGNNQEISVGTTTDNGDGTFTWTIPLSTAYVAFAPGYSSLGSFTFNEIIRVDQWPLGDFRITNIAVQVANLPPVANAGSDQAVNATSPAGAIATLNGSGSSVGDGTHLHYYWTTNAGVITEDAGGVETPGASLSLGVNQTATVTLKVYDVDAAEVEDDFASDTVSVSVVDTTVPVVTIIHPVDNSEIPSATIPVSVHVADNTATNVTVSLNAVTLTLDENGDAGGVIIKPNQAIDITATAVDAGGNEGSDTVTTIKVHDMRKP